MYLHWLIIIIIIIPLTPNWPIEDHSYIFNNAQNGEKKTGELVVFAQRHLEMFKTLFTPKKSDQFDWLRLFLLILYIYIKEYFLSNNLLFPLNALKRFGDHSEHDPQVLI